MSLKPNVYAVDWDLAEWRKWAGYWPIFLRTLIEQYIKEGGLQAITNKQVMEENQYFVAESATFQAPSAAKVLRGVLPPAEVKTLIVDNFNIRGGMKAWHLHYNNKIYVLNDKQAQDFANKAFAKCKEVLGNVKQVGIEEAAALAAFTEGKAVK
jgi:hypothetical protein